MVTFLTILLVLDVIVLIILVVGLQHGTEGGIGSTFGSGNSAGFFGASGGVTFIVRATWLAGALFFGLSTTLAFVSTREHFGAGREINKLLQTTQPATPASPTPTTIVTPQITPTSVPGTLPAATPSK